MRYYSIHKESLQAAIASENLVLKMHSTWYRILPCCVWQTRATECTKKGALPPCQKRYSLSVCYSVAWNQPVLPQKNRGFKKIIEKRVNKDRWDTIAYTKRAYRQLIASESLVAARVLKMHSTPWNRILPCCVWQMTDDRQGPPNAPNNGALPPCQKKYSLVCLLQRYLKSTRSSPA